MNVRNVLKPFSGLKRRLLGTLAVVGFFAAGSAVATASGPAFNNLPNDYPTLQVAKAGEQWSRSTTAQVGDTVNLFVWDHNTVPDTTAHNVRIKVSLPTAVATSHVPSATVSADNAQSVTGTATINVGTQSQISYVPGTATLYRNVNGTMQPVSWPAGVNPNDVIAGGVNLGDQLGCWTYAQAVMLQVKVEGTTPAINTNKQVQLDGGPAYSESANANPSDVVNFKVFLENTGNATGRNAQIVDALDSHLTYVPGSSIVKTKVNNQDVYTDYPDNQIQFNGNTLTWSFGDMAARPDAALYLQFQARLANADAFPIGTTTLYNTATSKFTGVSKDTNRVSIVVTRSQDHVISFTVKKEVTNLTLGDSKWYDVQLASAAPGDYIAYRLTVVNTGNTAAQNVTLQDILPSGISFAGRLTLYNRDHPNGIAVAGDALIGNGYVFDTIANGSDNYQTMVFDARISNQCSGTQTLTNWAKVIYGGQVKAQDDASLILSCTRGLIITKDVLDPHTGTYKDSVTGFHEGDSIVFRINVQNNGNTTVTHPVVRDELPALTQYEQGSLSVDGEFMSQAVQDAFWNGGFVLTDLSPGMGKVLTFRLRVTECPPFGDTVITNRAFVHADNVAEISDTASATVTVRRPGF